jgi:hydroxybutyrate-dimer hydrolase
LPALFLLLRILYCQPVLSNNHKGKIMVNSTHHYPKTIVPAVLAAMLLSGQTVPAHADKFDKKPDFIHADILNTRYDGVDDDLLTAGLGKSGLESATPPVLSAPPTAPELRRLAIYNNYRALVDMSPGGGYGIFYGPNIAPDGSDTGTEGLIPGYEFLTYADNGAGRKNVTLMVQVPDHFDPDHACIITAPSSGSRGVYGAIATTSRRV